MPKISLSVLAALLAGHTACAQNNVWGQKDNTYRFGQPKNAPSKKLPKTVPGRVHLLDGTSRSVLLAFVDYNKIVAVENGAQTAYTPFEVSSFVMKQDSFVVLRDFKVAIYADEQEFRMAFVRVGAVGPGYALYQFKGTMRREIGASFGPGGMGRVEESTQYLPSKVWFIKCGNDPRWVSLPQSGPTLKRVVEPIIADDKKLSRSVDWEFLGADGVQAILLEYAANKHAARP
jgi:hypothetical protein